MSRAMHMRGGRAQFEAFMETNAARMNADDDFMHALIDAMGREQYLAWMKENNFRSLHQWRAEGKKLLESMHTSVPTEQVLQ